MAFSLVDQYRNTQPAAPAAAPAPALPQPEIDYMSAFQSALGASRAGVERQFTMANADIAQREGLTNQAVGQLPGQLSSIYQQGDANLMLGAKGLDDAQKASGLASYMSAGAQMQPLAAARTNDLSGRQADVPLLRLATQTEFNRQRGAVDQARAQAAADQQGQLASFYADMAKSQADRAANQASTADDHAYQDKVRHEDQDFQLKLKALDGTTASNIDEATGLTKKRVEDIRNSSRYKDAVDDMKDTRSKSGGLNFGPLHVGQKSSGHKAMTAEEIWQKYRAYPQLLKVLMRDYPDVAAFIATGQFQPS